MHGTLPSPSAQAERNAKRIAAAEKRVARKQADKLFLQELARAKATPVPIIGAPTNTIFC